MDVQLQDKNNNGIPDWAEERFDDQTEFVDGPMGMAYTNEDAIAQNIPNYKDYKWYKQPEENYFYTLGEAIENKDTEKVENIIEENPEQSQEVLTGDLKKEAEQITDGDKRTDEISDEVVEKAIKKPGSFLIDIPTYNDMSIDDIEKADAAAMAGEAPYMEVTDEEPNTEETAEEMLTPDSNDYPTELPVEEDKTKEKSSALLSTPVDMSVEENAVAVPNIPSDSVITSDTDNTTDNGPVNSTSGVSPIDPSFSGGGSAGVSTNGIDVDIEKETENTSSNAGGGEVNTEVSEDGNLGSTTGANTNEALDNTFDNLSFEETEHKEDIKTNEQFELDGKEGHTAEPNKNKLPKLSEKDDLNAIKERIIQDSATWGSNNSGTKYLPYKFIVNGEDVEVSQIGTGRKESFEQFIKDEPKALKEILKLF